MSTPEPAPGPQMPEKPPPDTTSVPPPPLSPFNLIAALIIAVVLIYNLKLNADPTSDYDGDYVTYGLVIGLCLTLGVDISRVWKRRGE